MVKCKSNPTAAAGRGQKKGKKRARLTNHGADSGAAETSATESYGKKSSGSFRVLEHSDEEDIEDTIDDTINNGNGCPVETLTTCSFHRHVSHIIGNEEVSALMTQNCKYKWEIPAADIPKSKWVGTGEKIQGPSDDHLHDVKGKLKDHWQNTLSDDLSSRMSFFALCNSYRDIMYCNKKPFYLKGKGVDSSTMDAYLMHALNHVHRTRDVVIRNDATLRNDANRDILDDNSYLDQGFTRPKVLFLLPLKSFARRIVKRLIQLSPLSQKDNAMGLFKNQFGESEDEMEKPEHSTKPTDFDLLFAGDIDDHFLFGMKFTKKSVKLYSNFYASDVIIASPLALKRVYPKIQDLDEGGVLLFVSSYFEYIRISNFLKSKEASFCRIGEATSQQDISRSRLWFFEVKKKILLYSERSHFFHRYKIRGTHHLLFYSLPGRKEFYPELERFVGTSAARRLISSDKSMFVFC